MTDTLIELAERCEKATGPDRELDRAIFDTTTIGQVWRNAASVREGEYPGDLRSFTASLDAALTLVPGGWYKYVAGDEHGHHACVWSPEHKATGGSKDAATEALALTAAALRARASENQHD